MAKCKLRVMRPSKDRRFRQNRGPKWRYQECGETFEDGRCPKHPCPACLRKDTETDLHTCDIPKEL